MRDLTDIDLRKYLGPTLQTGALRAVLFLAGFSLVGALLAWIVR